MINGLKCLGQCFFAVKLYAVERKIKVKVQISVTIQKIIL